MKNELFGNSEQLDIISRHWLMECVEEVDNEANERVVAWMPLPKPWKGDTP